MDRASADAGAVAGVAVQSEAGLFAGVDAMRGCDRVGNASQ